MTASIGSGLINSCCVLPVSPEVDWTWSFCLLEKDDCHRREPFSDGRGLDLSRGLSHTKFPTLDQQAV
jgi:hypothetical protein